MKKKLGLGSGVAICVGLIVATSCLVSLGTGMGSIGRWFIIPLFAELVYWNIICRTEWTYAKSSGRYRTVSSGRYGWDHFHH